MKLRESIWDFLVITFATILIAAAVFFFMMPSKVSVGSIAAFAMVLANFIPLSVSALTMMMNVVLLILGFLLIGKEFGIKTVYTAILLPMAIGFFEVVFPNNQSLLNDQMLDVLCYCVLVAIGQSILFGRNASSGGLDIVAKFMNKYLHMELGKAVAIAGMAVALSSALCYDIKTVILSVLGTYFNGIILDHFIFGATLKRRVCIISQKEEEITEFILHELHSGATKYQAYGAYSENQHTEIITIVDKNEYLKLMNYITKADPDAFVTVYSASEVRYKPKVISKK